jgi:hypothetical protein
MAPIDAGFYGTLPPGGRWYQQVSAVAPLVAEAMQNLTISETDILRGA